MLKNELDWHVSSFCNNSACVTVAWRKSSTSNPSGNSVVVLDDPCIDTVYVSDDKDPDTPILAYSRDEWNHGHAVQFQPCMLSDVPAHLREGRDSITWYKVERDDHTLYFDHRERFEFLQGVLKHEFAPASN